MAALTSEQRREIARKAARARSAQAEEHGMNTGRAMLLATLCLFGVVATSAARDDLIVVHSFADTSCGKWVGSQHNLAERAQYLYWFRGFATGYNFGQPSNQVSLEVMPDPATLALYVDKFCRENPLRPFIMAAPVLVREIRARPRAPVPWE